MQKTGIQDWLGKHGNESRMIYYLHIRWAANRRGAFCRSLIIGRVDGSLTFRHMSKRIIVSDTSSRVSEFRAVLSRELNEK